MTALKCRREINLAYFWLSVGDRIRPLRKSVDLSGWLICQLFALISCQFICSRRLCEQDKCFLLFQEIMLYMNWSLEEKERNDSIDLLFKVLFSNLLIKNRIFLMHTPVNKLGRIWEEPVILSADWHKVFPGIVCHQLIIQCAMMPCVLALIL